MAGKHPETVKQRGTVLGAFANSVAPRPVLEASRLDVLRFTTRTDLRPSTRDHYRQVLQAFYRWTLAQGLIEQDPAVDPAAARRTEPTSASLQVIGAFLSRLRLAGMRPRTVETRQQTLAAFAAALAPGGLLEATRHDVEAFLGRPLSAASRVSYRAGLRSFYLWAVEDGLLEVDPTARVPVARVPKGLPRPITADELARLLAVADVQMRAWLLLMALGGLRCIEVSHLRPADLVPSETGTLLWLRECKGGGTGSVPAHPAVLAALADLPIRDGLWWTVKPATLSTQVGRHLRVCGVQGGAHRLRHYAGTAFYRASGHDLLVTARLLRHVKVDTTMIYAQLDPVRPAEVVNAVPLRLVEGGQAS